MRIASLLLSGFLIGAPAIALAQPAESPTAAMPEVPTEHGAAGGHGEGTGGGHGEGTGGGHGDGAGGGHGDHAAGGHEAHDPTRTYNWTGGLDLSYKNKDAEGGPLGDNAMGPEKRPLADGEHEEAMSVPFVLVLFNFGLLLIVLAKWGAPAARQMAEKRSDDIKSALDEAARLREQAKGKLAEYSSKLKAAEDEMAKMIEAMRQDAEAERARVIAAAEAQAVALKKDAEERIAAEIERARYALQLEVVAAATTVAEQLLRSKTTATDQASMVDAFVKNVAAAARQERT
ncbi:MAG: ATP synthase F0 subunit B [Kofleriaceae bacterium]|nr:ATP synthase F0 subunit B [Myxococcales bacterium]MCB9560372.1 ATP synthase F0 subunit B [Kofleriaceae bacterium]MCB9571700.1 ATP synthase F0 subunit B [Kofleriaceae bacterium]